HAGRATKRRAPGCGDHTDERGRQCRVPPTGFVAFAVDLTALTMLVMLAMATVGLDTVWHPTEVILEASTAGKLDKATVDENMINGILKSEVDRISSTPTLMGKPRVK